MELATCIVMLHVCSDLVLSITPCLIVLRGGPVHHPLNVSLTLFLNPPNQMSRKLHAMSPHIQSVIGVLLMAACGSVLGRHIGLVGFDQIYVAGLALGVVFLGQLFAVLRCNRIIALEEKLTLKNHQ